MAWRLLFAPSLLVLSTSAPSSPQKSALTGSALAALSLPRAAKRFNRMRLSVVVGQSTGLQSVNISNRDMVMKIIT